MKIMIPLLSFQASEGRPAGSQLLSPEQGVSSVKRLQWGEKLFLNLLGKCWKTELENWQESLRMLHARCRHHLSWTSWKAASGVVMRWAVSTTPAVPCGQQQSSLQTRLWCNWCFSRTKGFTHTHTHQYGSDRLTIQCVCVCLSVVTMGGGI